MCCGFLQGLSWVKPFGVLITEFDDAGELHQFLESVQCFGMGSEQGWPDVGIVGDDALAAYNADPGKPMFINTLRLFGSYLSPEIDPIGDVDIELTYGKG